MKECFRQFNRKIIENYAEKHGLTFIQAVKIIDDIESIKTMFNSVTMEEFLIEVINQEYDLKQKKGKAKHDKR